MIRGQVVDIDGNGRLSDDKGDGYLDEIKICDRVIKRYPYHYQAWNYRSYLLANVGQYEAAAESYRHTLSLKSTEHRVWCNYGAVLEKLNNSDEAARCYDRALKQSPLYFRAHYLKSKNLHRRALYGDAVVSYDQAIQLCPDVYKVWYYRGKALLQLNRVDQAIASFQQAAELYSDDGKLWMILGRTLLQAHQSKAALVALNHVLRLDASNARAWSYQAASLKSLGRLEEAIFSLDKAIALEPDNFRFWHLRGLILLDLEQLQSSEESLTASLKLQAYNHQAWLAMGWVLQKMDDYQRAIEAYDKSLAIEPDQPFAFYNQARCHACLGQDMWALEHLRRAMALDPNIYTERAYADPLLQTILQEDADGDDSSEDGLEALELSSFEASLGL